VWKRIFVRILVNLFSVELGLVTVDYGVFYVDFGISVTGIRNILVDMIFRLHALIV